MNYQMIRPISEESVQAIMGQRVLWQFSQNNYSLAVSNGFIEAAEPLPVTSVSVSISRYPYAIPTHDLIATASDNQFFDSMTAVLENFDSILTRIEFEDLYNEWIRTRSTVSSVAGDVSRNLAYYKIVGMGPKVLPFILERLRDETKRGMPDHWFAALWAISGGENPVPEADRGRVRKMAVAWLKWGEQGGYINADVGAVVS